VPAPCIRIQMHMQPPKSMIILTAYTPIHDGLTQLHFIQARNFMTDEKFDEDSLKRVYLVLGEDAVVLDHLKPARVPPTLADELLLESDKHGVMFRQKVQAREAAGDGIDSQALAHENDYARVIPSPARKQDPSNWVLRPVPLRKASASKD